MDDPFPVGGRQPPGDLDPQLNRPADGEVTTRDLLPQRLPFQQLGDEVGLPLVPADVVQDAREPRTARAACRSRPWALRQ